MKALILTSVLTLAVIFPSFATVDISSDANSASCNNGTLSKYDGSVNLQAEWEPNTINVKWYNDTEENGATTPSTTNTCSYSGALTVPAAPAKKTGYTFAGWRLRVQPQLTCPEITDQTTCNNTDGCLYRNNSCKNIVESCTNITTQTECDNSMISSTIYCDWCVPSGCVNRPADSPGCDPTVNAR